MYEPFDINEIVENSSGLQRGIKEIFECKRIVEAEIERYNREFNDITHAMEDKGMKYKERSRKATELSILLRERRKLKDWVAENKPLWEYLETDKGKQAINMLSNIVGISRKSKENRDRRIINY